MTQSQSLEEVLAAQANQQLVTEFTSEKKVPVVELFGPTIQGEGPLSGTKTMFVRFGGCDYRCAKCDSLHAVLPQAVKANARRLTQLEIFDELVPIMEKTGTKWVTLSGGNPCMWNLDQLQNNLQQAGYYTAVETQGTLAPDWLQSSNMVVISPKSPGMGEKFELDKFKAFVERLRFRTMMALKVVVFSQQDIEFALGVGAVATDELEAIPQGMRFMSLGNPTPPTLDENMQGHDTSDIVALMREYRLLLEDFVIDYRIHDWKFLPQIHVLAYGNEQGR